MSESEANVLAEIADLVEDAQLSLDRLREEEDPEAEREDLQHLYRIAQEAAELLETIDVSELPDTVDGEAVIAAVEAGELEAAIEEGDLGRAVDYKALLKAIDFGNLASSTELTDLVSEGKEFKDAVDDATDDGGESDDSVLGIGAESGAGDDTADDDGLVDGFDATIGDDSGLGGGMGNVGNLPDEAYQVAIQQKAMKAVDEFRAGVLAAHDKLRALHEKNREQMRRQHDEQGTNSRNPTAHSTVVTDRGDVGESATQHSTIPTGTKYSTAPTRTRIYGNRFDRRRQANDTTQTDDEDRTGR